MTLLARDVLVPRGLQAWDERTLIGIRDNRLVSFSNAILLESFGNLAYMVPAVLVSAIVAARAGRPLLALSLVLVYVLQRPIVLIGWQLWDRARPTIIQSGDAAPPLHSFPSGHSALVVSFYGLLAWLWIRSSRSVLERMAAVVLLALLAVIVGWARLRLGTHWPSDVIAGTVLGACWGTAVIVALHRAESAGGR
jgi:undecaprenyl-diphosphatase